MTALDIYKQRLKESKDYCEPHWSRAIDNYKHYLGRLDVGGITESQYPFESKMVIPISYEIVETVFPRIIGRDPEFTAVAIEPDDVPYEQVSKITLETQYSNPKLELLGEPIYLKLQRGVKEQLITGNAVWRAYWRRQNIKRMRYLANLDRAGIKDSEDVKSVLEMAKKMQAQGEVRYTKKLVEMPFLDDFDIRHIPFFMFFPDVPMVETGRMRYKIERDFMTFEELADEAVMFKYEKPAMDEIAGMISEGRGGFTPDVNKDFMQEYYDLFDMKDTKGMFSTDDNKIPLLIVDKMWMGDRVHVFVNEKWQLTPDNGIQNPYDLMLDPFIFGHDSVIPHSYFNYGEIDAIRKLEDGVTDIFNMRFDNLLQSMLNFWFYNPNLIADGDEFVPVPNSLTAVKDVDKAVRMIAGKDVTPTAYREAGELIAIIQRVTGVSDYVKGIEGETLAGRTYGGLRLVQEMANARFIVKSRLFEKVTLKALGYFMLEMSRQFITKDRVRRMIGESGYIEQKELKAGELKSIKGFMDIQVVPNSSMVIDQQAEAIKLNAVADRFMTEKGPFKNIPEEVFDKFLLKYLQAYGITDAIYWVRSIREARNKTPETKPTDKTEIPEIIPGAGTTPTLQSDQIVNQPNPLEQIIGQSMPQETPPAL